MTQKIDQAAGARTVFSRGQRWALLAIFTLLVVCRIPHAWTHGRFQDEEVTVFFAYAWHHPWLDALFRPFAGYWNLAANATTLLVARLVQAGIVRLEVAPYWTMLMALAVQILPAVLLLTGRAPWLAQRWAVIVALLILSVGPGIEEVFFNVLHIQFHLALCTALILALDPPERPLARIGTALLLFLAPLCGPAVLVWAPLFCLRALIDRDRRRLEQMAAFAAGGLIQLLIFYGAFPMRGHWTGAGTVAAAILVRLIAMPMFGFGRADDIAVAIDRSQMAGGSGWLWAAACTVIFFAGLIVLAVRRRDAAIWLLLSSLVMIVASLGVGMVMVERGALFDLDAERYNFLPLVLLCWTMIVIAARRGWRWKPIPILFLLLTMITGISRYTRPLPGLRQGPSWPAEVAAWRRDHNHPLMAWPEPYAADLSDAARPCTPIGPDLGASHDPRYCESGWVAAFYRPLPKR